MRFFATALIPLICAAFESFERPKFEPLQHWLALNGVGFDWDNHEVHTEDGFILNIQRLTDQSDRQKPPGPPVLLMHGLGGNGARFLRKTSPDLEVPLPVALARAGYDVWLGNNRGTQISSEHESLHWIADEAEYWNFSFPELGVYDLTAMIETIREETNNQKVNYIGTSLGTTQLFYGLQSPASKAYLEESLTQAIALAPVLIPKVDEVMSVSMLEYQSYFALANQVGLQHQIFGPEYDQRVEGYCPLLKVLSDDGSCEAVLEINDGYSGFEAISTKVAKHYGQNFLAGRFQEFSDCWSLMKCHETELIQLDQIENVPLTLIFGEKDTLSDFDFQSDLLLKIGTKELGVQFLEGYEHLDFCGYEPDAQLQSLVLSLLQGDTIPSDARWETQKAEQAALEAQQAAEAQQKDKRNWFKDRFTMMLHGLDKSALV